MCVLNTVFGKILKQKREKLNLSQESLADLWGVSRNFVSLVENGEQMPSIQKLWDLAGALNTKPDDLLRTVRLELEKQ